MYKTQRLDASTLLQHVKQLLSLFFFYSLNLADEIAFDSSQDCYVLNSIKTVDAII